MPVCRKVIAVAVVLLAGSAIMLAADAKGWYDVCCDATEFHFSQLPENAAGKELRVRLSTGTRLPLDAMPDEWLGAHWKVTGRRCDSAGNCEEAIKADFKMERVTKRHVSGRYLADFNGQHLEGQFTVKYRQRHPLCICE